jgi:hypothetical protein
MTKTCKRLLQIAREVGHNMLEYDSPHINALPTKYDGHEFRSRLEAKWAVMFNCLGIPYEYEPHCVTVSGDGYLPERGVGYLPDFYLPDMGSYAEVKPELPTPTELYKCQRLAIQTGNPVVLLIGQPAYKFYPVVFPCNDPQTCDEGCSPCHGARLDDESLAVSFYTYKNGYYRAWGNESKDDQFLSGALADAKKQVYIEEDYAGRYYTMAVHLARRAFSKDPNPQTTPVTAKQVARHTLEHTSLSVIRDRFWDVINLMKDCGYEIDKEVMELLAGARYKRYDYYWDRDTARPILLDMVQNQAAHRVTTQEIENHESYKAGVARAHKWMRR